MVWAQKNPEKMRKLSFFAIIGFLIFAAGTIIYVVALNISRAGKIPITVKYAPFSATVEMNNVRYANNQTHYIEPGEYTVMVTMNGFEKIEFRQMVMAETKYLYGLMTPNSEEGEDLAEKYRKDFSEVEALSAELAIEDGKETLKKWPIIQYLPIENAIFRIGYTMNETGDLTILINTSNSYLDNAIEKLISLDDKKEIAEYNIKIETPASPFLGSFQENKAESPIEYLLQGLKGTGCKIFKGTEDGDYYYTIIATGSAEEYNLATYRVILKKIDGYWQLVSEISPILTTYNTLDVPIAILNTANALPFVTK